MKTNKSLTTHPPRRTTLPKAPSEAATTKAFAAHLHELRRRLYYAIASVLVWGSATYAIQEHVVNFLLRPANGQHFIYTSVGGGIDFLFRICVYSGLVLSTPVIVYNVLEFISPLMSRGTRQFIILSSIVSALLAGAGIAFGYFIGLPAALHFLFHQFTTAQIKPLITIQAYLSFVIAYMLGSALLFQLPMILLIINRMKPLKPQRLLHYERWVILAAFVLAGLMNPSPNLFSQLLVAGPFILMYQVGIGLIALVNRSRHHKHAGKNFEAPQASPHTLSETLPKLEPPAEKAGAVLQHSTKPINRRIISDINPRTRASSNYMRPVMRSLQVQNSRPTLTSYRPQQRSMDFLPPVNSDGSAVLPEI